jgi:hypothetical protein
MGVVVRPRAGFVLTIAFRAVLQQQPHGLCHHILRHVMYRTLATLTRCSPLVISWEGLDFQIGPSFRYQPRESQRGFPVGSAMQKRFTDGIDCIDVATPLPDEPGEDRNIIL